MSKEHPDSNALFDIERYDMTVHRTGWLANKLWGVHISGIENVPPEGAAIIDISHRSLMDPWFIAIGVAKARRLRGMIKEEVLNWYYLGLGTKYFAPRGIFFVNRSHTSSDTWRTALGILRQKEAVAIAEEGTHKNKGRALGSPKDGPARLAVKIESEGIPCPVIPVGMNSEAIHKRIFRQPLNIVIGEPMRAAIEIGANKKVQKEAAEQFGDDIHRNLQRYFEQAIDLKPTS